MLHLVVLSDNHSHSWAVGTLCSEPYDWVSDRIRMRFWDIGTEADMSVWTLVTVLVTICIRKDNVYEILWNDSSSSSDSTLVFPRHVDPSQKTHWCGDPRTDALRQNYAVPQSASISCSFSHCFSLGIRGPLLPWRQSNQTSISLFLKAFKAICKAKLGQNPVVSWTFLERLPNPTIWRSILIQPKPL
jgi:hypothetical protein